MLKSYSRMKIIFSVSSLLLLTFVNSYGDADTTLTHMTGDSLTVKIEVQTPEKSNTTNTFIGFTLDEWKTIGAVIVPLLVLLVTNIVTLVKIRLDSAAAIKKELYVMLLKNKKERLEKFYDPIVALLSINQGVFDSFGPKTFSNEGVDRNVAIELWLEMRKTVIGVNNLKISEIIKGYSHLITDSDTLEGYINFIKHSESYNYFMKSPNEIHNQFRFPADLLENTKSKRKKIIDEIVVIERNLDYKV
jgi:hypothetical protein